MIIYVFFILPLKIKWIAWIYAGFLLLSFVTQSNSFRMAFIAALSNYLIFFGPGVIRDLRQRKEVVGPAPAFRDPIAQRRRAAP